MASIKKYEEQEMIYKIVLNRAREFAHALCEEPTIYELEDLLGFVQAAVARKNLLINYSQLLSKRQWSKYLEKNLVK